LWKRKHAGGGSGGNVKVFGGGVALLCGDFGGGRRGWMLLIWAKEKGAGEGPPIVTLDLGD